MLLCLPTSAQTLNLDGPPAPAPGTSLAALELASRMQRSAERYASAGANTTPADRAKHQLRLSIKSLAELGDRAGTDGSHIMLAAMTLDRRLEALDELIDETSDPLLVPALAADLERVRLDWERGEAISPDQLDRDLRYIFAQAALIGHITPEGAGWFLNDLESADASIERLLPGLAEAGISDADLSVLRAMIERLALMDEWPGYQREARERRVLIAQAADAVTGFSVWITPPAREKLAQDFADAITATTPEEQRTLLQLLGAQREIMDQLTDLGEGRSADRLRSRASQAIEGRTASATEALAATRLAIEILDTSRSLSRVQQDENLLRQVRTAWRSLVPDVRNIVVSAQDAAVNLLVDPTKRTDPGELASIAALNRIAGDFRSLERFSQRFAPAEGERNKANSAIAERLLALGQDMSDEELRETSLRLFRELDAQLDLWDDIDRVRERASRVVGDRRDELDRRLGVLLDQWLAGWGTPGGFGASEEVAQDLRLTRDILRTFADVNAFTDLAALESWPGFEMSPAARGLVTQGLTPAIDTLTSELIRGPSAIARERAQRTHTSLRGSHGPALLAGRLARLSRDHGIRVAGPIAEIALGPPTTNAWMAQHRDALADIAWAATELNRQLESDPDASEERTEAVRAHLRWRALRTLEAIEREARND